MSAPGSKALWSYELTIDGVDTSRWLVEEFEVEEAVSDGCRGWVEAYAPEALDPQHLAYKKASLAVRLGSGETRRWHGIVLAAEVEAAVHRSTRLRVTLGARLELLRSGKNSRIFQDKSVTDIAKVVLAGASAAPTGTWSTTTTYEKRPNTVQYDESDYDFLTRILHDEGIWFAVQNDEGSDDVAFFDDAASPKTIAGAHVLHSFDALGPTDERERVVELRDARAATSDAVMLQDYCFKHPSLDQKAKAKTDHSTGREVYLHPGDYRVVGPDGKDKVDKKVGQRKAERLLQRLRVSSRVMRGRSDCPRLEPGRSFSLQGHHRAAMNIDHLVLRVVHRGQLRKETETPAYENEFVTIPSAVPYRPQQAAPPPVLGGPQLAFATCPPGEEIHADEGGRAKVRFPWDRANVTDDKSSTWLRVGQFALPGSMTMPRKDFEVIVDFELGEFDRPVITGHLYNGMAKPPYALPGGATRSSIQTATTGGGPGANEVRFEDKAGAEEIFINASKDYSVLVDNDSSVACKVDETYHVGSNREVSVGADYATTVQGSRTLSVGANQEINVAGGVTEGVAGSDTITIGGMRHLKCGGDLNESVKSTLTRTVGSLQAITGIAGYQRAVKGSSSVTVGAAWVEVAGGDRSSVTAGARHETIGALKLVKAKSMTVSAGAAYTANVGGYSVQCGGGRTDGATGAISVAAGGGWSIKATNISFVADNKLVLVAGGTTVTLSKSGDVQIKAAGSIKLEGLEKLKQIKHDSGG